MNDVVLGVRFTGDAKGLINEVKLTRAELQGLNTTAKEGTDAAAEGRKVTEDYAQALKKQYETLGDIDKAQKEFTDALEKSNQATEKAKGSHESLTAAMFKGVGAVELVRRAWEGMKDVFKQVEDATVSAQQSHARLEAVLRATGDATGVAAAKLEGLVDSLQKTTQFDDGALREAATTIATFGRVSDEAREKILRLGADLAATGRGDLQTWVTILSKVGTEPAEAIGLFERSFGKLEPQLKVAIANAAEFNDKQTALNLLLDEGNKRVGGTAVESYKGLARQLDGTEKAWTRLKEAVGAEVFSAKSREAGVFERALDSMASTFKSRVDAMRDAFRDLGSFGDVLRVMMGLPPEIAALGQQGATKPGSNRVVGTILPAAVGGGDTAPQQLAAGDLISAAHARELRSHELALEAAHQDALYKLRQDATQRAIALEDFRHDQGLEAESDYFGKRAALGEQAERDDVTRIKRQIAIQNDALKNDKETLAGAVSRQSDADVTAALTAIADRKAKIQDLNVQLAGSEAKVGEARKKAAQDQYAADAAMMDREAKIIEAGNDTDRALQQQTAEMQLQYDLLGKTEEQQAELTNQHKLDLQLAAEQLKIQRQIADLKADTKTDHSLELDDLTKQLDALPEKFKAAGDAQTGIIRNTFALKDQTKVWGELSDIGSKFFSDLVTGGRGAFQSLGDMIKKFAADMIALFARRWILNLAAQNSTGDTAAMLATQAASAGQGTAASAGTSFIGQGLSAASGYIGTGMEAMGLGGGFSAAAGAGFSAGVETLGIAATAGAEAVGGMASVIGAAIPVIGWIVAIGAVLYSIFGSKGGGPKQQGAFAGAFGPGGNLTGTLNGAQITDINGDNQDAAGAQAAGQQIATSFYGALRALGGTSSGIQVGVGYSRDNAGTAPSFAHTVVRDANGNTIFQQNNDNVGRGDSDLPNELKLQGERAILAALQASDLPASIQAWLHTVNAASGSQADLERVLPWAQAVKGLIEESGNLTAALEDMATGGMSGFRASLDVAKTQMENAQRAFDAAKDANDPVALLAAEQNLRNAIVSRYSQEIQLVRQLESEIAQLKQQSYEFTIGIMQRIAAAGGGGNVAGFAFAHAQDLRGTIGGNANPTQQLTGLQGFLGSIDTWYQTQRSRIEADIQAQQQAAQNAAAAAQAAMQARIAGLNQELQITQQWAGVVDRVGGLIDSMRLSGTNPLAASGRLDLAAGDAAAARAAYESATGIEKINLANKYVEKLQAELGLLGEVHQRPSPEYQTIYDDIISQLSGVQTQAQTQADKALELQAQIASLTAEGNAIAANASNIAAGASAELDALNAEYIAQLQWAQTEGERLYNLQIQQHQEQLIAITGGQEAELFIAGRVADAASLLRQILGVLQGNLANIGAPVPTPGNGTTVTPGGGATPVGGGGGGSGGPDKGNLVVPLVVDGKVLTQLVIPLIDGRIDQRAASPRLYSGYKN